MTATHHIIRIDGSTFDFTVPVENKKMAREMVALTIENYTEEGWFIKHEGEFDIWMVRGIADPTIHFFIG